MALLILLLWVFAGIGIVAVLMGIGAIGMWLVGRIPRNLKILRRIAWSVCGALAIVGLLSTASWLFGLSQQADKTSIDLLYIRFHTALRDGDIKTAYACMSPDYRRAHSIEKFKEGFGDGPPQTLEPGRYLSLWGRTAELYPGSDWSPMNGEIYKFAKFGDDWYFTGEYRVSFD